MFDAKTFEILNNPSKNEWNFFKPITLDWDYWNEFFNGKNMSKTRFTAGQDIKKGDKVEILQGGYAVPVLNEQHKKAIIRSCLLYAIHRIRNHKECGISGMCEVKTIERILDEIK